MRPSSADKKKHGMLDTSAAREALTALEYKQTLEKRIHELNNENTASQNDVMRLQATLAETEFMFQKKTATFQETIAELLDEVQSLKADMDTISKIPREKILLWALKEKESVLQFTGKLSGQESRHSTHQEISNSQEDASKHERSLDHLRNEMQKMQIEKYNKLEIALKESQEQLEKSQDKLRLKSEEVLLMQLKVKESGRQQGKQTELSSYILKLEDTVTSLSEELSDLKDDLASAKDLSQSRQDEISSQMLLRHQKRFLSDRNALIATHGKLMVSMAQMSNNFSTEIRAQLSIMRESVFKSQQLMKSVVIEASQKLLLYSSQSSVQNMNQNSKETQNYSSDVKTDRVFSSGRVSKAANPRSSSESMSTISRTAHLKTLFAGAKGVVEAEEAIQSKLAAEAHAAAFAKVEEEWAARVASAKVVTEVMVLKGTEASKQTEFETRGATQTKCLAHVKNAEELKAESDAEVKSGVKHVVHSETFDAVIDKDLSDVSSFSDDPDLKFKGGDKGEAASKTKDEKSAALVQAILAATLAMTKPHIALISNESAVIKDVSIDEWNSNARNTFVSNEGNAELHDRPASAEAIGSSLKQLGSDKSSFLNNVIFEDALGSVTLKSSIVSKVAEKSGRKVLKGTSKTISDKTVSPKV